MADGYTHDPDAFDEDSATSKTSRADGEAVDGDLADSPDDAGTGEPTERRPAADPGDDAIAAEPGTPESVDREFDWRGWILVGAVAVSFLVIPGVILGYPYVGQQLGLSFYDTYLVLPMVPAVILALLAVWATTRP